MHQDNRLTNKQKEYGLIGFPLTHSFSEKYFADKFTREKITDAIYRNYPVSHINLLPGLLKENPQLIGLNVTIPYKETVIPYLDELSDDAAEIGAVNTIKRRSDARLLGFNSDIYGFAESLDRFMDTGHVAGVLILGTGGASKAVEYVCRTRGYQVQYVSRTPSGDRISYDQINRSLMEEYQLIVNTTPVGMHPDIGGYPEIPFDLLTPQHRLFDLIYNPAETAFLKQGAKQGCRTKNGMEMLILQAEKSWEIWNNDDC